MDRESFLRRNSIAKSCLGTPGGVIVISYWHPKGTGNAAHSGKKTSERWLGAELTRAEDADPTSVKGNQKLFF